MVSANRQRQQTLVHPHPGARWGGSGSGSGRCFQLLHGNVCCIAASCCMHHLSMKPSTLVTPGCGPMHQRRCDSTKKRNCSSAPPASTPPPSGAAPGSGSRCLR